MTLDGLAEFGKVFGLPGLVLLCWFLLERDKNKRNEKLEEAKIAAEREKTAAMTVGFQSLSGKIDTDIASHVDMAEGIAEIKGMLTERSGVHVVPELPNPPRHQTPRAGVGILREVVRGKSHGDR